MKALTEIIIVAAITSILVTVVFIKWYLKMEKTYCHMAANHKHCPIYYKDKEEEVPAQYHHVYVCHWCGKPLFKSENGEDWRTI